MRHIYMAVFILMLGFLIFMSSVLAQAPQKAQIVFSSNRDGNYEIYIMDTDGKNQRNLTNSPTNELEPDWSPDGQKIAFNSMDIVNGWIGFQIYVMDADGGNKHRLSENFQYDFEPDWSSDNKRIIYSSMNDGDVDIYIMDVDGRNKTNLTKNIGSDQYADWFDPANYSVSPSGKLWSSWAWIKNQGGDFR